MDIEIFLEKFAEELSVPVASLTRATRFRELPTWTSLQALLLLSMIEEEFGVLLSSEEFKKSESIGDLFEKILARKK